MVPVHLDRQEILIKYPEKKIVDFADFRLFLWWGVGTGNNPSSDRKDFSDLLNIVYELTSLRFTANLDDKPSSVPRQT